uniref:KIB1-4 beta-propeller domain-containing protein n=1 Tax=Oryza barthii TaxID=65489 RepID=A0A0D3G3A5_9ORYZ
MDRGRPRDVAHCQRHRRGLLLLAPPWRRPEDHPLLRRRAAGGAPVLLRHAARVARPGGRAALPDAARPLGARLQGGDRDAPLPRAGFAPQIFLSGDPLAAAASPGWMAIASQPFSVAGKWQTLFFWRPGDAAWTPQREPPMDRIDSAAFHGGFFYLTVRYWYLYAYDLRHDAGAPWPPPRVRSTFVYLDADRACELSRQGRSLRAAHVVAAADGVDLLLAVLYWECHRRSVQMVAKVFRMEWAAAAADLELSPVTDLGEHALLLGRGDALALFAAEFPAIRRNCVYFVEHDNAPHRHWAIAMDLGANASELIPHPQFQEDEPSEEDGKCAADRSLLPYSWFCLKQPFFKHK